jgi:hypothetical protein
MISAGATRPEPYEVPKQFNNMTVHHAYGIDEIDPHMTFPDWLTEYRFGFLADLKVHRFSNKVIEETVNADLVKAAPWPEKQRSTDFFWIELEGAHGRLQELADLAVELCFGQNAEAPVGGNFASVGSVVGNQQLAIAGLIYAREQGRLREIPELGEAAGPLYVVRDSFSGKLFEALLPEEV